MALPLQAVWQAHEDLRLLERISPPYPVVRLLDPPQSYGLGSRFTVRVDLLGPLGLDWEVEIIAWEPPTCFVDRQVSGPFQFWEHRHEFTALSEQETELVDRVQFELNPLLDTNLVRPALEAMFRQRLDNLKRALLAG